MDDPEIVEPSLAWFNTVSVQCRINVTVFKQVSFCIDSDIYRLLLKLISFLKLVLSS